MFVDLGVYGLSTKPGFAGRANTLRRFEKFTLEKGGFQALYAETLMSYEEFGQMFKEHDQFYSKVNICRYQSSFIQVLCRPELSSRSVWKPFQMCTTRLARLEDKQ